MPIPSPHWSFLHSHHNLSVFVALVSRLNICLGLEPLVNLASDHSWEGPPSLQVGKEGQREGREGSGVAADVGGGCGGGGPAGRQASLWRGEDWKTAEKSSKYHSAQDLSLPFSDVSSAGKRLVRCDGINISSELGRHNKSRGNGGAGREGCQSGRVGWMPRARLAAGA